MPLISGGGGGGTFNGGTITTPLVVAPSSPNAAPLTVQGPTGLIAAGFDLVEVLDENSADRFQVFPDGAVRVDQAAGESSRIVSHASDSLQVSDGSVSVTLSGAGTFRVFDSNGVVLRVLDPLKIGFYGHTPAAQQSVTSGTVTPEQLALALQANGTLGGT